MSEARQQTDVDQPSSGRWLALAVCCSALFMTLLDVSITNVALPSIGKATDATSSQLQWVVSGYTLTFGMVPVLAGKLGDDYGRRVMFQLGVVAFALTSAFAGLAPSADMLIAARFAQGIAGGLINPQVSGLVQQMFSGADRGKAFGFLGTTVGLGTALGPLLGGVLIALGGPDLGWRLVFFVNVPIGLIVVIMARRLLPEPTARTRHRLDIIGALLIGGATLCVLGAAVEYDSIHDIRLVLLIIPASGLMWLFVRRERRLTEMKADPLVDFRLFRTRSYTSGVLLGLTYFPAFAGFPLVLALYYQQGLGYTALLSALGVTAYAAGNAISAPIAGRLVTRIGRKLVVISAVMFGLGAVSLALVAFNYDGHHAILAFAGPLLVMGLGSGGVVTPNQTLTLADVDPLIGSAAGGVLQTAQRIGIALGQVIVGAVFFAAVRSSGDFGHSLGSAALVGVGFVLIAITIAVADLRRTGR
ncbi:MAG: MFS transporter [Antricoccus sp.]